MKLDDANSVSMWEAIVLLQNSILGVGPLRLGRVFKSGIIIGTLCNIATLAVVYAACWLVPKLITIYQVFTFEDAWKVTIGKGSWIISITVITVALTLNTWMYQNICFFFREFIHSAFPHANPLFTDTYFILFGFSIIFVLPALFTKRLDYVLITGHLGILAFIYLAYLQTDLLVDKIKNHQFNPDNKPIWFGETIDPVSNLIDFFGAYASYIYTFPALANLRKLTFKRAKKTLFWLMVFMFAIVEGLGLLSFFVYFDRMGDQYITVLADEPSMQNSLGSLFTAIKLSSGIAQFIQCTKDSVFGIFAEETHEHSVLHGFSGVIFLIISIFSAYYAEMNDKINVLLMNIGAHLVGYTFPAIMLLTRWKQNGIGYNLFYLFLAIMGIVFVAMTVVDAFVYN